MTTDPQPALEDDAYQGVPEAEVTPESRARIEAEAAAAGFRVEWGEPVDGYYYPQVVPA